MVDIGIIIKFKNKILFYPYIKNNFISLLS